MSKPAISLVTTVDDNVRAVREKVCDLKAAVDANECVGIAFVLLRRDGGTMVGTYGYGNRVQLLGAVTDLQHIIAKDGDS